MLVSTSGCASSLVVVLFWLGKVVITRLRKIFNGILRRRNIEGVAVSLLDSVFTAILYIALLPSSWLVCSA